MVPQIPTDKLTIINKNLEVSIKENVLHKSLMCVGYGRHASCMKLQRHRAGWFHHAFIAWPRLSCFRNRTFTSHLTHHINPCILIRISAVAYYLINRTIWKCSVQ